MRKILTMVVAVTITAMNAQAQEVENDDLGIFNHASLAVGLGTTGISADLSMPISPYVGVRGGVDILPYKYHTDLKVEYRNELAERVLPETFAVTGKLSMTTGHALVDLFPSKTSTFRITAGAYLGSSKVAEAYNTDDGALAAVTAYNRIMPDNQKAGYPLGDYMLTPDEKGNVHADITVNKLRPYIGIGFGRSVPTKSRVACLFDLGVQFWGKPKVSCQDHELTEEDFNGEDGGLVKYITMTSVCPVLNFRVAVRLF